MPKFDPAVCLGPWKGGQEFGTTLSYLQATKLKEPLKLHPLLECLTWDPKPYGKYLSWNVLEFPDMACIYIDYDDTPTGRFLYTLSTCILPADRPEFIKERFQPATWPKVEELHLLHDGTGWSIRIRNLLGVNITDVLEGIFDCEPTTTTTHLATTRSRSPQSLQVPLYVDELGEMHPRAVRVMEQQYFEKRSLGFIDTFEGYRKSDALLGQSYFNGIRWDPIYAERKLNFRATNVFVLNLGNC